jgi:hypothetical protein
VAHSSDVLQFINNDVPRFSHGISNIVFVNKYVPRFCVKKPPNFESFVSFAKSSVLTPSIAPMRNN